MYLPSEIQYKIISFSHNLKMSFVCKNWNREIKIIRRKYANYIGLWYSNKRVNSFYNDIKQMVRWLVVKYPESSFLQYPEFAVYKLRLNPFLLDILPDIENRKKSDVKSWMLNMPITLDDWEFVGI